jgi:hypothetical protein
VAAAPDAGPIGPGRPIFKTSGATVAYGYVVATAEANSGDSSSIFLRLDARADRRAPSWSSAVAELASSWEVGNGGAASLGRLLRTRCMLARAPANNAQTNNKCRLFINGGSPKVSGVVRVFPKSQHMETKKAPAKLIQFETINKMH